MIHTKTHFHHSHRFILILSYTNCNLSSPWCTHTYSLTYGRGETLQLRHGHQINSYNVFYMQSQTYTGHFECTDAHSLTHTHTHTIPSVTGYLSPVMCTVMQMQYHLSHSVTYPWLYHAHNVHTQPLHHVCPSPSLKHTPALSHT